ncbi:MAG: TonB-dependent receptor [Gammaproteobacteria bacterium]|nr:TonB-dependent receptor [Gammaproteobacteria bacterium]
MCNRVGVFIAATLAGGIGAAVTAQDATRDDTLTEVVVTAQRRVENLQQVPVAATALDPAALDERLVARLQDLETATPALSITNAGQTQSVNIRGIGLASNSPNATAGVATYVDGLFQPPIVQANSFYDLASVEVFRGPQGTLVGTNSTGGAIFINSRAPQLGRSDGYVTAGFGNFGAYEAEAAAGFAPGETLAVRVAGFYRQRDSFYRDVGPYDNDAGKLDEKGGRIGLLWQPGAFSALLRVQANDLETGGYAYRPIAGTFYESWRVGDQRTLSYDTDTSHRERALLASLDLKYQFGSGVLLRSLSGYQYKRINSADDIDGSQAPPLAGGALVWDPYYAGEKQYSQELNLISPTDGRLDWILGGYFQRNEIDVSIHDLAAGFPTDIFPANRRTTTGLFAQTNYGLTEALELQFGLRHSTYKVTGEGGVFIGAGIPGFPPGGLQVADLAGEYDDDQWTGKVALNWHLTDNRLLYVFAAKGYKPGGFNSVVSQFRPEKVWNYELGWKDTFLDQRLRLQVAAFYNDYADFQFDVIEPITGQGGIQNVADGTIQGVEAQLEARVGEFRIDASAAYVDSQLDGMTFINTRGLPPGTLGPQCPVGVPSTPPLCFDYAPYRTTTGGGPNLYSPEWTLNVGIDRSFRIGRGVLVPRLNYSWVDPRYTYPAYSPVTDRIGGFGLWSALLTCDIDAWRVQGYVRNLGDQTYVSGQAAASQNEFYGAPREYGLRVTWTFQGAQ